MNLKEKELEVMELLKKAGREYIENEKNNNGKGESTMKVQTEINENVTTRQTLAQGIVKVLNPILKPSIKLLALLMFFAFLVIGSIAIVEFSKYFSEMALKISSLSADSTHGGLIVIACYVTGFIAFIQRIPAAYGYFIGFADDITKAVK